MLGTETRKFDPDTETARQIALDLLEGDEALFLHYFLILYENAQNQEARHFASQLEERLRKRLRS